MSKKPLKERWLGKALWAIGDTFKGKTPVGKVLDETLEILPLPNPIRYVREHKQQKKLKRLKEVNAVRHVADAAGVNLDDLIEDSPAWVRPALAFTALIGLLILVGMGIIEPSHLIEGIKAIFGN